MKLRYLNGEKVYVDDRRCLGSWEGKFAESGKVGICKHRDIVRILNSIFKHADSSHDDIGPLRNIIHAINTHLRLVGNSKEWQLPFEIHDADTLVFDDQKVRQAKEPRLNAGPGRRASNPQNVSEEQAVVEPEQAEMLTIQDKEVIRNMRKDTFVNLDLLYEKIDKLLEDMDTKVFMAKHWLEFESKPNCLDSCWVPDEVKSDIERSKEESEKAKALLKEIRIIMCDFKMKKHQKPANVISERVRVGHMNVIYGGQYKSMVPRIKDDALTGEFKAFLEKERSSHELHRES